MSKVASDRDDVLDLLTCSLVKVANLYHSIYRESPWAALGDHKHWLHFIRSRRLTPALPVPGVRLRPDWPAVFATNGLLVFQHPDKPTTSDQSLGSSLAVGSSLGVVTRVRNLDTGELRVQTEYDELYRQLKRELAREVRRVPGTIPARH